MSRTRVSAWAPVLGLAAFLLVGTRQAYTVPFTGLGLSPARLILFLTVALWLLTRLLGRRAPAGLGLLGALVVGQLLITLLAYGAGIGRMLSPAQQSDSGQALAADVAVALLVFALVAALDTRRDIELVLRALVLGGALSGTLALLAYGTGVDVAARLKLPGLKQTASTDPSALLREGLARSQGAAAAPLELGGVMTVLIPLALGLYFVTRRRGGCGWVWAAATLLLAGGAVVSLSRSVFVGLGVAVLVMMLRWPVRRSAAFLGAAAVVGVLVLLSGVRVVSALVTVLTQGSDDYSLASRSNGRAYVWEHFAQHFWLGQGPGTYDLTTQPVLDNQYLSQLMETGVLGLLALVAVLLGALGYAMQASTRRAPDDARELATALAGALAGVLVVSSVLDTAGFEQIFTLIWLLVGLTAALWRLGAGTPRGFTGAAARAGAAAVR